MAKKTKDKKISRAVLLGAMEKLLSVATIKAAKELSPIINDMLNRYDPNGEAHGAFLNYQEERINELRAETEGTNVPKKIKKPKAKKPKGPKYKKIK